MFRTLAAREARRGAAVPRVTSEIAAEVAEPMYRELGDHVVPRSLGWAGVAGILLGVLVAACETNPPPEPDCLTAERRAVGRPCTASIQAEVLAFESLGPPPATVAVRYNTAWDSGEPIPFACPALATSDAATDTGFHADFSEVTCQSPGLGYFALMTGDAAHALAGTVHRIPAECFDATTCLITPTPTWVLAQTTWEAWKATPGLASWYWGNAGVVVVTYRDASGAPVANVRPVVRDIFGATSYPVPGEEVFFLADDRTTIAPRGATGASGTAIFPAYVHTLVTVGGEHVQLRFDDFVNAVAPADGVTFVSVGATP